MHFNNIILLEERVKQYILKKIFVKKSLNIKNKKYYNQEIPQPKQMMAMKIHLSLNAEVKRFKFNTTNAINVRLKICQKDICKEIYILFKK